MCIYIHIYIYIHIFNTYIYIYIYMFAYSPLTISCHLLIQCWNISLYLEIFGAHICTNMIQHVYDIKYMDDIGCCRKKVVDSDWFHLRFSQSGFVHALSLRCINQSHYPCKVGTKMGRNRSQNKPEDSEQSSDRLPNTGP